MFEEEPIWQFKIHLIDPTPIRQQIRLQNSAMQAIINKKVDRMMQEDVIEPSENSWSSPIVLADEKNGKKKDSASTSEKSTLYHKSPSIRFLIITPTCEIFFQSGPETGILASFFVQRKQIDYSFYRTEQRAFSLQGYALWTLHLSLLYAYLDDTIVLERMYKSRTSAEPGHTFPKAEKSQPNSELEEIFFWANKTGIFRPRCLSWDNRSRSHKAITNHRERA